MPNRLPIAIDRAATRPYPLDVVATISPPAPIGEATTGEVPHPISNWGEFMRFAAGQGPLFSFTVAGEPWVWVNDPELAIAILKLPFDKIGVGPLIEGFEESGGIGNALTANYSPSWRPRRVLLQRPLSYRNVRGFGDIFARQVSAKARRVARRGHDRRPGGDVRAHARDPRRDDVLGRPLEGDRDDRALRRRRGTRPSPAAPSTRRGRPAPTPTSRPRSPTSTRSSSG